MVWDNIEREYADRIGEPELFSTDLVEQEWNSPYFEPTQARQYLYEAAVDELLAVRGLKMNSLGAATLEEAVLADNADVPSDLIEVVAAAIRLTNTDEYLPATRLSPAQWFSMLNVDAAISTNYALIAGKVRIKGDRIKLVYKRLPEFEEFQTDQVLLPDDAEQSIVDRARKLSLIEDYMPRAEN